MDLLNFILENTKPSDVQKAVKEFRIVTLAYDMRSQIHANFPDLKPHKMVFGIAVSEALKDFKTDSIRMQEINNEIIATQNKLKSFGKWHSHYKNLVALHDFLVEENNKLNKPITDFLKLYKKAQKNKGKKISVVKKKELNFDKPI